MSGLDVHDDGLGVDIVVRRNNGSNDDVVPENVAHAGIEGDTLSAGPGEGEVEFVGQRRLRRGRKNNAGRLVGGSSGKVGAFDSWRRRSSGGCADLSIRNNDLWCVDGGRSNNLGNVLTENFDFGAVDVRLACCGCAHLWALDLRDETTRDDNGIGTAGG